MNETQTHNLQPTASERIRARRIAREKDLESSSISRVMALGAAMLAVGLGVAGYEKVTEPKSHTVTEIVQPFDAPEIIAKRAEKQYGHHPEAFNPGHEGDRIVEKYGLPLQPGEKIEVHVK